MKRTTLTVRRPWMDHLGGVLWCGDVPFFHDRVELMVWFREGGEERKEREDYDTQEGNIGVFAAVVNSSGRRQAARH